MNNEILILSKKKTHKFPQLKPKTKKQGQGKVSKAKKKKKKKKKKFLFKEITFKLVADLFIILNLKTLCEQAALYRIISRIFL